MVSTERVKWLEHVVGLSVDKLNVKITEVLNDINDSNHLPLMSSLGTPMMYGVNSTLISHNVENSLHVDWFSINA